MPDIEGDAGYPRICHEISLKEKHDIKVKQNEYIKSELQK